MFHQDGAILMDDKRPFFTLLARRRLSDEEGRVVAEASKPKIAGWRRTENHA